MKYLMIAILVFFNTIDSKSQDHPKLIVGIVVDQLRYDYIDKFKHSFGENGINRVLKEGFYCRNVNYNYKPTYTGPGHASIYTATTPSVHGIVGNNWYSKKEEQSVYCVKDKNEKGEEWYSPNRMLVESFADGMKHFFNHRSKSYGVSLKDRGAILPAGHLADGAYWFSSKSGRWESSAYYPQQNAEWLNNFNAKDFKELYLPKAWNLSRDLSYYASTMPDDNEYESPFHENIPTTFPYDLEKLYKQKGWGILKQIPHGNQMTYDLSKEIIVAEKLGKDEFTDFISISFSATDYVGHRFGTQSMEVQDTYIKLDETIAQLLSFIDGQFAKNEVLLFITSDHGAGMPRNYLKEKGIPHGKIDSKEIKKRLEEELDTIFGNEEWVATIMNLNVYFNETTKEKYSSDWAKIKSLSIESLSKEEGIYKVLDVNSMKGKDERVKKTIKGVLAERSGDLIMIEHPNWTSYSDKGSTHGSPYAYDTHVPVLYYGFGIKQGESTKPYPITSIIPTISFISKIPFDGANSLDRMSEVSK